MMQKLWLKKLMLNYSKEVFDIVQFGSSVIEGKSPKDIDIAVIFNKIPLKDQLDEAQKIKVQLQKRSDIPIHIKSFDLYCFFDRSNFAKEGILFYGKSLISGNYFANKLGLSPLIQIYYSLKNLEKKDKIMFNYLLNGKGGKYGLLRKYNGRLLKPGLVEVYPEFEKLFADSIREIITEFEIRKVLC